jgi:hypothetical protein
LPRLVYHSHPAGAKPLLEQEIAQSDVRFQSGDKPAVGCGIRPGVTVAGCRSSRFNAGANPHNFRGTLIACSQMAPPCSQPVNGSVLIHKRHHIRL